MNNCFIILAAGESKRFKSNTPKPYFIYKGIPLILHSINKVKELNKFDKIIAVINKKHKKFIKNLNIKNVKIIFGGKNRAESSYKALMYLKNKNVSKVFIHDAARPNFSLKLLKKLLVQLKKNECVIPTLKSYDSTKLKHNKNIYNINRNYLHFVQTPQAFNYKSILSLQKNITSKTTDDSSLFISAGKKVKFINGEYKNNKITLKSDTKENKTINFGIGFDIHRLVKKKKLYLGGLKIPYHSGLKGHSDGDVIIHALIDSLLGSCKLKDIGTLFSDKNVKYKNIRSSKMLKKVLILIKKKGFYINNMDINIIAEKPKIGHYRKKIIKSLSKLCDINEELINIKGKTTEKLGLIGKEKAIACEVISSVFKYV